MRILPNICSSDLPTSKRFYTELLGLRVKYDSDWYVQLCLPENAEVEFGIIQQDHDLLPAAYQHRPDGMYVTFVVDDVDASYQKALQMGATILQQPKNEFYGQRRFLCQGPEGCLIDICSPWQDE